MSDVDALSDIENIFINSEGDVDTIVQLLKLHDYSTKDLFDVVSRITGYWGIEVLIKLEISPIQMMRFWIQMITKEIYYEDEDLENFLALAPIEITPEQTATLAYLENVVSRLPGYSDLLRDSLFSTCSFEGMLYRGSTTELDLSVINQWFSRDFSVSSTFGSIVTVFETMGKLPKLLIQNFDMNCQNLDILPTPQIINRKRIFSSGFCDQAEAETLLHNTEQEFSGWINPLLEDQVFVSLPQMYMAKVGCYISDIFSGIPWFENFLIGISNSDTHFNDKFPLLDPNGNPIIIDQEVVKSFSDRINLSVVPERITSGRTYEQVIAYILERYYDFKFEGNENDDDEGDEGEIKPKLYRHEYPDFEDFVDYMASNNVRFKDRNLQEYWGSLDDINTIYKVQENGFYAHQQNTWKFFYLDNYILNLPSGTETVEYADLNSKQLFELLIGEEIELPFKISSRIPKLRPIAVGVICGDRQDTRTLLGFGVTGCVVTPNYPVLNYGVSKKLVSKIVKVEGIKNTQEIEFSDFLQEFDPEEEWFSRALAVGQINVCDIPHKFYVKIPPGYQLYINFIQTFHQLSQKPFDMERNTYDLYQKLQELWQYAVHQDLDINIEFHDVKKHLFVVDPGRGIVFGKNVSPRLLPYIETVNKILIIEDKFRLASNWSFRFNNTLKREIIKQARYEISLLNFSGLQYYKEITDDLYTYGMIRVNQDLVSTIFKRKEYPMNLSIGGYI